MSNAGNATEAAMSEAITQASKDCEAIWARDDLSEDEKRAQMADIMQPDNVRGRMLAARDRVKGELEQAANEEAEVAALALAAQTNEPADETETE